MPSSCACSTVKPLTVLLFAWSRTPLGSPAASITVLAAEAPDARFEVSVTPESPGVITFAPPPGFADSR